jgi:hypothetical protein
MLGLKGGTFSLMWEAGREELEGIVGRGIRERKRRVLEEYIKFIRQQRKMNYGKVYV